MQSLITAYNAEHKILIGSANYFQNKRVRKHFPNCGHYLSRPDLYLFLLAGYFGLLKKYWNKFNIMKTYLDQHISIIRNENSKILSNYNQNIKLMKIIRSIKSKK